ncbi:phosphotransferase enzyme family protein [Penicillium bovifimosum]|uniref:Phosphotransferase enzyme family protein n=1 Tax=Penicillium bovifimosum TaxID=126998 RepID=A0A9W9H440_9EURO|nr:phosphotransferase enzyme family protein [Penicillium bovifimosum]KAJ5138265.1 phosphotransferase enzyme family protein [Penicillium bovifimosum]
MAKFSSIAENLPDESMREMNFLDPSFLKEPGKSLPTPAQVRALPKDIHANPQPQPVIFEESKVFVKFGPYVTIAEAQSLWIENVLEVNWVMGGSLQDDTLRQARQHCECA